MTVAKNLSGAVGMLAAPWLYLAGRALSSSRLSGLAISADPQYLRAIQGAGRQGYSRQSVAEFQIAALLSGEATAAAAERIKRLLAISESQLLQDVFCAVVLDEKERGFFVEVGVGSGRSISNTYMLEKHYAWDGLLCEPNRSSHDSIAACRSALLERRAAASTSGMRLRFEEVLNAGEFSRIAGTGDHKIDSGRTTEYEVETVSLTETLSNMAAPSEIDYLSLDTEGSEVDILRGLDLSRFKFKVMTIEHNFNSATQSQIGTILKPFGYRKVFPHISGFDAWYVHESVRPKNFPGIS